MKKLIIFSLVFLIISCSSPLPKPIPKCWNDICIHQAFALIDNNNLIIDFELTKLDGTAEVGDSLRLRGKQLVGAFLIKNDKETYLFGVNSDLVCYQGNDIPWANGKYAAVCGIGIPMSQLSEKVNVGDIIRVEFSFDFKQLVRILR